MLPSATWTDWQAWRESLLASRFAAPTSAGVLFTMLAAAGLSTTWLFRKARILAIFDALDTVLFMIPLQMLMIGLAWQLGIVALLMVGLLALAWRYLHRLRMPKSWPWVLGYATVITGLSEVIYLASKVLAPNAPVHIEVLLPAFVLGCMLHRPIGSDPHRDDHREGHLEGPESRVEQGISTVGVRPRWTDANCGHAEFGAQHGPDWRVYLDSETVDATCVASGSTDGRASRCGTP